MDNKTTIYYFSGTGNSLHMAKAIQYGKHTLDRERYNHPHITIKDLINQKQVNIKIMQMEELL